MSVVVICCSLWVLCATVTALLPMRFQYVPGLTLMLIAPGLLIWLGAVAGWVWAVAGVVGFVSMFRNPLRYLYARARGLRPDVPR